MQLLCLHQTLSCEYLLESPQQGNSIFFVCFFFASKWILWYSLKLPHFIFIFYYFLLFLHQSIYLIKPHWKMSRLDNANVDIQKIGSFDSI